MTVKTPAPPPLPAELERAAAPPAAALRPPGRAGGDRDRDQPALGTRRSPQGAARRGGRRPRPGDDPDATPRVQAAGRQDVRRLGTRAVRDPRPDAAGAHGRWNGSTAHEVLAICGPSGTGKIHFIEALGHLAIDKGRTVAWHTPETLAQLLRRHRVDDSVNKAIGKLIRVDLGRDRRRRATSDLSRRGRGAVPRGRRRLRETLDRDLVEHPPVRVRRADAQEPRDRDRRTAAAPRARPDHRRAGQLPTRPGDRRQGGPTTHLTHRKPVNLLVGRFVATSGEK